MNPALSTDRPFRRQKMGLIFFGGFAILLGLICLLFVPLLLMINLIPPKGQEAMPLSMFLPTILIYLFLGILNITLGVGSILCKRWARSLIQLVSIYWLVCGVLGMIVIVFIFVGYEFPQPQGATKLPKEFYFFFKLFMTLFIGVIYIIIPSAFTWFYSLRNTRLACESFDPMERWTDRCPQPVLGMSLVTLTFALSPIILLPCYSFLPLFGLCLQGISAVLVGLIISGFLGFCAWGMYRLKIVWWWGTLIGTTLVSISYISTFYILGTVEIYRLMKVPAETMKIIESMPFLQDKSFVLLGLLYLVPYLAYMLYIRRFFRVAA
ncbi:MAG: hypothetical protein SH807_06020 [Blastochloris sp.]|nr:hypothetical protein [Blastochloris sp.]